MHSKIAVQTDLCHHISTLRILRHLLCKLYTDYILISLFVCAKHVWSYASCLSSALNWGIQMPWTSVSYIWKLYQYLILVTCGFYKNPSFKYCSFQWYTISFGEACCSCQTLYRLFVKSGKYKVVYLPLPRKGQSDFLILVIEYSQMTTLDVFLCKSWM